MNVLVRLVNREVFIQWVIVSMTAIRYLTIQRIFMWIIHSYITNVIVIVNFVVVVWWYLVIQNTIVVFTVIRVITI